MNQILIITAVFPPEPVVTASISSDIANSLSAKHNVEVICPTPTRPKGFNFSVLTEGFNLKISRLNSYTCPGSVFVGICSRQF